MAEVVTEKVCYDLPLTVDTNVFGPVYWNTFHDLANRIPCGGCREESESFIRFWHDLKNEDLKKPLFDKANYQAWLNEITKRNKINTVIIVSLVALVIITSLMAIFKK